MGEGAGWGEHQGIRRKGEGGDSEEVGGGRTGGKAARDVRRGLLGAEKNPGKREKAHREKRS